jgi:hypothetical protein
MTQFVIPLFSLSDLHLIILKSLGVCQKINSWSPFVVGQTQKKLILDFECCKLNPH